MRRDQFSEGFYKKKTRPHDASGLPLLLAPDVRVTLHVSQFGSFEKWVMTWCPPLHREIAGSLSHGVPFTFVFVPTSSSRIGSGTSAFLSAIEVFPPVRSLSQRAGLSLVRHRLHGLGVKEVQIHGRRTEYRICVVQMSCVGCLPWDITSLLQDILVRLLLSAWPVLSQTSTMRHWIACSPVSLHCGLQTEFASVSLTVISSLTSTSFSNSSDCDRATQ